MGIIKCFMFYVTKILQFSKGFTTSSNKLYSFNVLVLIGKDFLTFTLMTDVKFMECQTTNYREKQAPNV